MEKCVIKARWQNIQEQRKFEEEKVAEEQNEDIEDVDKVNSENGFDFKNIKPTDFKNNKRVILPETDDDAEEIMRNNLKN